MIYYLTENEKTTRQKRYASFLINKHDKIVRLFNMQINPLLIYLRTSNLKHLPSDEITIFSLLKKWNNGEFSSIKALNKLKSLKKQDIAHNKIVKKLEVYLDRYKGKYISKEVHPQIINRINVSIENLKKNVVPEYVEYLKLLEKYFDFLYENFDKNQIKTTVGHTSKSFKGVRFQELTLNQTIKYFKAQKITELSSKYIANDYVLTFESLYYDKIDTISKPYATYWILAPNKNYKNILCNALDVKDSEKYIGNKEKWFSSLDDALKTGVKYAGK